MDAEASQGPSDVAAGDTAARPRRTSTIYDVARIAGVSHQTVSRFLKGHQGMRPETRERVSEALERLDYRPNLAARSLARNRSHRIGVLSHGAVAPSRIALGVSAAARAQGYVLDLVALDATDERAIDAALAMITRQDIAGVLALANTDQMLRSFERLTLEGPVHVAGEPANTRTGVDGDRARAVIKHLTEFGHTNYFHVGGPSDWAVARKRRRAYESVLRKAGHTSHGVATGDWTPASGYEAALQIPVDEVTAVVVANDEMAMGVVRALADRGCRVPEDVSVTGIDDIPNAAYFTPPLTTLRLDFAAEGRIAFAALLAKIEGSTEPPERHPPVELIVRASTGPARTR